MKPTLCRYFAAMNAWHPLLAIRDGAKIKYRTAPYGATNRAEADAAEAEFIAAQKACELAHSAMDAAFSDLTRADLAEHDRLMADYSDLAGPGMYTPIHAIVAAICRDYPDTTQPATFAGEPLADPSKWAAKQVVQRDLARSKAATFQPSLTPDIANPDGQSSLF